MSDDTPRESAEQPVAFDGTFWGAAVDVDPTGANIFTAEIENVDSSDWEVDPDVIWGDELGTTPDVDGGTLGADFLV
jgi:hypothetical protein